MQTYNNNIKQNALKGFYNAIHQAKEVVGSTMGAAGKNIVIEIEQYPYALTTNDGATAIEHMHFEDPLEKIGINFLKEVVGRSNKNSGDGSTTTTVLVEAILKEGMSQKSAGMEIKRSLDACIPLIEESIAKQRRIITSDDFLRLKQVATISSEDELLGEMLAEVYGKIGANGIIEPEYVLGKEGNSYTFIQGVRFANQCGLLSQAMVHDEEAIKENRRETRAVYENPVILVTRRKIANVRELDPAIKFAIIQKKDLVIFADDMDSQAAQVMINNHRLRKDGVRLDLPRITIVKAPTVWKDYVFEDFSKCVGATVVCDPTGVNFKNLEVKHFGTCEKIIIEQGETRLIGTQDLTEHIAELQVIVDSGNDHNDDALRRIGWLTAQTVLLKVGGLSETELTYKRLKAEDAINATRSALSDGIVAGGGVTFVNIAKVMPDTIGGNILKEALKAPFIQINLNAGSKLENDLDIMIDFMFTKAKSDEFGVNVGTPTRGWVNMFENGIIDSAKISLNAVKNAIGIASTVLTASSCITLPPKEKQLQMVMPNMPGM